MSHTRSECTGQDTIRWISQTTVVPRIDTHTIQTIRLSHSDRQPTRSYTLDRECTNSPSLSIIPLFRSLPVTVMALCHSQPTSPSAALMV